MMPNDTSVGSPDPEPPEFSLSQSLPVRLAAEEALPRLVLESVGPDFIASGKAVFIADPAGNVLWANHAWQLLGEKLEGMGLSPELVLDLLCRDVAPRLREGQPMMREEVLQLGGGAQTLREEYRGAFEDGVLLGFAGVIDDEALLAQLRAQSRAVRERLEDITRLVSDWIWETNTELRLTFVSARITEVLGFLPREVIGRSLLDLGNFVEIEPEMRPLNPTQPRPFRNMPFVMRHADGTPRQFRIAGMPVFEPETGRFRGFRGTTNDVTAEAKALGLVAQSRSQLTQAISSISDGFALYDSGGRLLLCNQNFLGLFPRTASRIHSGLDDAEILRRALVAGDLVPGKSVDRLLSEPLTDRAKRLESLEFELADGRWIRSSDRLTADGSIVGIRTDITEMKQRERALMEAKEAAESANRAKSQFVANISHELRTPLNAIIGFSELILAETMGPIGNPNYRDYLQDVLNSGRHLLEVINDILDLAKAEAGQLQLQEDATDFAREIRGVVRLMRERSARARVTLVHDLQEDVPPMRADPRKLRQILLNLVSNAIKFTPAGGTVRVGLSREGEGPLVLRVSDTGIGIAVEDLPTALRPFGQVDGTLSRKYEGTGLGLPLTNAMVELHGGTLTIDSVVDHGTTIVITFPESRFELQ